MDDARLQSIQKHIRDIPDFPIPGVVFKDITPLLASVEGYRTVIELFEERFRPLSLQGIVAIESRGFLFASPLAIKLGIPLHIARKPGKLPWHCDKVDYALEYGTASLEIHRESIHRGDRILIMDDLLATGGTAAAAIKLVEKQGAEVVGCGFVIELGFLNGREKLNSTACFSLIRY